MFMDQILVSMLDKRFVLSKSAIFLLVLAWSGYIYAEPAENQRVSCSVLFKGVENGTVKTKFYDSVCSFGGKSEKIRSALSIGRYENLKKIKATEDNAAFVENELSDSELVRKFFSNLSDKHALEWFRKIIETGLNPNMIVSDGREKTSLLSYALGEGNIKAAIMLLQSGATPHIYRKPIWGKQYYELDFLFPLDRVSRIPGNRDEKADLIRAMLKAGLFILTGESGERYLDAESNRVERNKKIIDWIRVGGKAAFPSNDKVICSNAEKHSKYDWCQEAANIPEFIVYENLGGFTKEFEIFQFISLIGVYEDTMYFMTLGPSWYSEGNVGLARVTRGGDTIVLYRYTRPAAGMGHCSRLRARARGLEPGDYIAADRDASCWRRIVINRSIPDDFYIGPYETKYFKKK
jgi:hypothetical protein